MNIKEALDGLAQFIIMNDNGTDESASAIEWHGILKQALERAKKEHELLGLYREFIKNMNDMVHRKIQPKDIDERMVYLSNKMIVLEEELK